MEDSGLLGKLFPGKNTDILLEKAGSLARLLNMTQSELVNLGADKDTAERLTLLAELSRRYFISAEQTGEMLTGPAEASAYLAPYFTGLTEERLFVCCLNGRAEVLGVFAAGSGSADAVGFDVPDCVSSVLRYDAKGVILAHNHPGGFAVPSRQDISMTKDLSLLLRDLDITVCDHIIFAGKDVCFMSACPSADFLMWSGK